MKFQIIPEEFLILIVDDTDANIRLLSHVLRADGFSPIVAFNGTDALELIESRKPDIVLLDIMMPDMTGYEVCRKVNQSEELKTIPIIFLSALSETSNKVEGFEAGGVDYVTKPFQKDEVLARIRTHLYLSKLQKERDERIYTLRLREKELSELNTKKDNLMRMVSHDIKNPLTGIVGLANLIKENPDLPLKDQKHMLDVMETSGQKLLDMVEGMLDNENSINQSVNYSKTSLRELANKVISVNNPKAILKKIELQFEDEIVDDLAFIDHAKLEVALNNLVSNALKFTLRNGKVILRISTNSDFIDFVVEDSGIGIPSELTDKLFIENGTGKKESKLGTDGEIGTGLGLDVVQKYVNIHEGKIWVKSDEGVGTSFYIKIPRRIKE